MRYFVVLAGLGLSSTALAQDCTSAYDPTSPTPRVDFYNCLDDNVSANRDAIAANALAIEELSGRVAALEEGGAGNIAMWCHAAAGLGRFAMDTRIDAADVPVDTLTVVSSAPYDHQLFISGSLTGASGTDGCNTHCWLYVDGVQVAFVDDHGENCEWTYMTWSYTTPSVYPAGEHTTTMLCDNQAGDWSVLGEHSHNQVMTVPQ